MYLFVVKDEKKKDFFVNLLVLYLLCCQEEVKLGVTAQQSLNVLTE